MSTDRRPRTCCTIPQQADIVAKQVMREQ